MELENIALDLIIQAESVIGEKCSDWEYWNNIIFQDGAPHLIYYPETLQIQISLSKSAMGNDYCLMSQLSHEIAHVVSPVKKPSMLNNNVLVLHEGISEYFSLLALNSYFDYPLQEIYDSKRLPYENYFNALNSVIDLFKINNTIIKNIRKHKPYYSDFVDSDFTEIDSNINNDIIKSLLRNFT